jgi:hypothetical protein
MGRAIVVMVSTLLFGIFGLFVGWLNVQAILSSQQSSTTRLADTIVMTYTFAPSIGAGAGFVLSVIALQMFAAPVKRV